MELLLLYISFAITTGICSCIFLLAPLISQAKELGIKNNFTDDTILSYMIYTSISTLIAPIMILPIFIPSISERFTVGLSKTVLQQD